MDVVSVAERAAYAFVRRTTIFGLRLRDIEPDEVVSVATIAVLEAQQKWDGRGDEEKFCAQRAAFAVVDYYRKQLRKDPVWQYTARETFAGGSDQIMGLSPSDVIPADHDDHDTQGWVRSRLADLPELERKVAAGLAAGVPHQTIYEELGITEHGFRKAVVSLHTALGSERSFASLRQ